MSDEAIIAAMQAISARSLHANTKFCMRQLIALLSAFGLLV